MNKELALRITIDTIPANVTVPSNIRNQAKRQSGIVWVNDRKLFRGEGAEEINDELREIRRDVERVFNLLCGYGIKPTSRQVADAYRNIGKGLYSYDLDGMTRFLKDQGGTGSKRGLLNLMQWYVDSRVDFSKGSVKNWNNTLLAVRQFLDSIHKPNLLADHFDSVKAFEFIDWMRAKRKGKPLKHSYINENLVRLKSVLSEGYSRGYIPENRMVGFKYRFVRDEHTNFITQEQLNWLMDTDFTTELNLMKGVRLPDRSGTPGPYYGNRMQEAVDLFIFSCYTGFHYADREELCKKNASYEDGQFWIEKVRRKTKRFNAMATIKLHPHGLRIVQKYGGLDYLPRMEYWTNLGYLNRLGELMGLPFRLTTGIARNTFANMALNEWGLTLETTAAMMGLKVVDTIRKYAKVERKRVDKEVIWDRIEEGNRPSPKVAACRPIGRGLFTVHKFGA